MSISKLPLYLTLTRIVLVLPTAIFLYHDSELGKALAAFFFIVASITDYYDGYYARKLKSVTNLGKFLDPVADKILVTSILILLLQKGLVDPVMALLFVGRDTIIGGVRAAAAADKVIIDAQSTGKWKAALQMVAIPMLLIRDLHEYFPNQKIGYGLLWLSVLLSLKSGYDYCMAYYEAVNKKGLS